MQTPTPGAARRSIDVRLAAIAAVLILAVVAAVAWTSRNTASADSGKAAVGEIYQLQAAFHRAKTTQDLDLMLSLWAPDAVLHANGKDIKSESDMRAYWAGSPSFKEHRFSLVPSFKEVIQPKGDTAYLYFECHDVASFDQSTRTIAGDTFLAGTVRLENGKWLFYDMSAGAATPLSIDHYYYTAP